MSAVDKAPELLPCPFCGVDAAAAYIDNRTGEAGSVVCLFCDAGAESVAAWNRRADLAAPSAPEPQSEWLIHKAGRGWYRPNAQGYTSNPAEAGRYSHDEALSYSHPNGWDGPRDEITIKTVSEVLGSAPSAPAEVEGLVERNLAIAEGQDEYAKRNLSHLSMGGILRKNATALTAQQAEIERLREGLEVNSEGAKGMTSLALKERARAEKAEAERDALAVAVREIKEAWDWWREDSYDRCSSVVEDAISAANAKLKGDV